MKILNFRNLALCFTVVSTALVLDSCGIEGGLAGYDDIYADDSQIAFEEQNYARSENKQVYQDPHYSHSAKHYREQINTNTIQDSVINEDFDMDDYYDYAYTARLHRFHDPAPIYGYYDDHYTDLYWYDRDPLLWGTSIYYGYRWWWPSYSFSWGWGWSPWRHYGWYGDWWGWHHGWYGYDWAWGWYGGPHHGHFAHNPHYYNSHDSNSGFYRPEHEGGRLTRATAKGNSSSNGNSVISRNNKNQTFGERYNQRFGNNTISRGNASTISRQNDKANNKTLTRNTNKLQKPVSRTNNNGITRSNVRQQNNNSTINRNNNSANRNNQVNRSSQKRTYTPPMQRQQRNSSTMRNTPTSRNSNANRHSNINTSRSSNSSSISRGSVSSGSRSSVGRSSGSSHSSGGSRGGGRR